MTKDLLRQMIREMVKEEVRATIPEVLAEIFAKPEQQVTSTVPKTKIISTPTQSVVQKKKEYKKYTSNELLNKALNETVGGLPKEGSMVASELAAAPSVMDQVDQAPPVVAQALTKNYSALMKAIDKKKGSSGGSNAVSMM